MTPRLFTARYQNPLLPELAVTPVGVTVGRPRMRLPYMITEYVRALAPHGALFRIDDRLTFEPLYRRKLERLGLPWIVERLAGIAARHDGRPLVLLCFERVTPRPEDWCHRLCFAQWWYDRTGEVVLELPEERDAVHALLGCGRCR